MMKYEFVKAELLLEEEFQRLLWLEFRDWVRVGFDTEMHHVLGEWEGEELVGLCVVDKHTYSSTAVLQSLQGRDVGELLDRMEAYLKTLKTVTLSVEWERRSDLDRVLIGHGWSTPEKRFETYYFYMPGFNPYWFRDRQPLPPGFETIVWEAMTDEEKADTERWASQDSYLLSDHNELLPREAINSLILRFHGKIAGWVETHRQNGQMIR